jgi:hypothetical protein
MKDINDCHEGISESIPPVVSFSLYLAIALLEVVLVFRLQTCYMHVHYHSSLGEQGLAQRPVVVSFNKRNAPAFPQSRMKQTNADA